MKKMILLVLCFVSGSFILAGCSTGSGGSFEAESYTSDTQIKGINLDVRDREIEVSLSEDDQIHIDYYESSEEYYDISVSDENVLTMTGADDKDWTDYIGGKASAEDRKISLRKGFWKTLRYPQQTKISHFPLWLSPEVSIFLPTEEILNLKTWMRAAV